MLQHLVKLSDYSTVLRSPVIRCIIHDRLQLPSSSAILLVTFNSANNHPGLNLALSTLTCARFLEDAYFSNFWYDDNTSGAFPHETDEWGGFLGS